MLGRGAERAAVDLPDDQREFDALAAYNRELAADCRKHTGPIYDHADTAAVVKDIDALRKALGERKINYYGVSYGTLIGQQYAEKFGRNIRAMVIDSNMDHSLGTWRFNETEAETAEDSFREFVKWCDRTSRAPCTVRTSARCGTTCWRPRRPRRDRRPARPGRQADRRRTSAASRSARSTARTGSRCRDLLVDARRGHGGDGRLRGEETARNPFPAVFCQDWAIRVKDHRSSPPW